MHRMSYIAMLLNVDLWTLSHNLHIWRLTSIAQYNHNTVATLQR
jgi:hypothetical protein